MLFGIFDETTIEGQIIKVLSDKWPQTTPQIQMQIEKEYNTKISAKELRNILTPLIESGVIKQSGGYFINHKWVQKWKIATEEMHYKLREKLDLKPELLKNNKITIEFGKPVEIGEIALKNIMGLPNPENKPFMLLSDYVWPTITLSQELQKKLKELHENNEVYLMSAHKTILDEINAKAYTDLGAKIIFKPKYNYIKDTIVHGNYVCHIDFDPKFLNLFKQINNITNPMQLHLKELFTGILEAKYSNKAIILNNQELANEIREKVLNEFAEKQNT